MVPRRVTDYPDVEIMRQIRNECRSYMTHHTDFITYLDQKVWWHNLDHRKNRCYLYQEDGQNAGYGFIRQDSNLSRFWLTGGLAPWFRNRGLGKSLFQHLIKECFGLGEVWLEVSDDNIRARKLYDSLGFMPDQPEGRPACAQPGITIMRLVAKCPT